MRYVSLLNETKHLQCAVADLANVWTSKMDQKWVKCVPTSSYSIVKQTLEFRTNLVSFKGHVFLM